MNSFRFISLPLLFLLAVSSARQSSAQAECRDWQACRQLALDAAAKKEFDAFHDLAWKTLQLGPKNDPQLMLLLARAQSLSGRPHDALVMLNRLASMGAPTDAATSDDFERVRALPAWAELEAKIAGKPAPAKPPEPVKTSEPAAPPPVITKPTTPETPPVTKPEPPPTPPASTKKEKEKPAKPVVEPPPPKPAASTSKPAPAAPAPLKFAASAFTPVGLAYDGVSGRFLIGDRQERRLLVMGERSGRLSSLAGADGGLDEITAFEIDAVEGDLWVASTGSRASTVHKLQLVSGRILASIALPSEHGTARFTDVAVLPQSILILDGEGRRLFRAAKKGKTLDMAARLAVPDATSLAPAPDGAIYVAYDQGLLRVDPATRALMVVEPGQSDVRELTWIRWQRNSLLAIQKSQDGSHRLVRIRLEDSGRSVRGVDAVDGGIVVAGPTSVALTGSTLYYLAPTNDGEIEVRKAALK